MVRCSVGVDGTRCEPVPSCWSRPRGAHCLHQDRPTQVTQLWSHVHGLSADLNRGQVWQLRRRGLAAKSLVTVIAYKLKNRYTWLTPPHLVKNGFSHLSCFSFKPLLALQVCLLEWMAHREHLRTLVTCCLVSPPILMSPFISTHDASWAPPAPYAKWIQEANIPTRNSRLFWANFWQ